MLEREMRTLDECGKEKFGTLFVEYSEGTIAILRDRVSRQMEKPERDRIRNVYEVYGNSLMSAHMLEVSLRNGYHSRRDARV